jgi:hypothetical protein
VDIHFTFDRQSESPSETAFTLELSNDYFRQCGCETTSCFGSSSTVTTTYALPNVLVGSDGTYAVEAYSEYPPGYPVSVAGTWTCTVTACDGSFSSQTYSFSDWPTNHLTAPIAGNPYVPRLTGTETQTEEQGTPATIYSRRDRTLRWDLTPVCDVGGSPGPCPY